MEALIIIFLSTLLCTSHSLQIHIFTDTQTTETRTLSSYYTTLGDPPKSPLSGPLILLNHTHIDQQTCTVLHKVRGGIIVYGEGVLPPLRGCNNDDMGMAAAFGRMAQRSGALGAVIASVEKFSHGRVVGFTKSISIPIVVVPKDTLEFISLNSAIISQIEFSPIAPEEEKSISHLTTLYVIWMKVNASLFGALMILFGCTIYIDFRMLREKKLKFTHSSFLKWMAFASALCSFLWHVVDPFCFHGIIWWYSCILKSLMLGFSSIVTLLVLRIWISAPLHNPTYLLIWSIAIYFFVAVLFTTSVGYGVLWHINFVVQAHMWSHVASLLLGACGYIYFGRNLVAILLRSKNVAKNAHVLPVKIATFITLYVMVAYSLAVIAFLTPIGIVIGTLLVCFVVVLILCGIFAILFYPKMKRMGFLLKTEQKGTTKTVSADIVLPAKV